MFSRSVNTRFRIALARAALMYVFVSLLPELLYTRYVPRSPSTHWYRDFVLSANRCFPRPGHSNYFLLLFSSQYFHDQ